MALLNLDPEKLLIVFAVALVVLGPQELPRVARELGRWMRVIQDLRARLESEVAGYAETLSASEDVDHIHRYGDGGGHDSEMVTRITDPPKTAQPDAQLGVGKQIREGVVDEEANKPQVSAL